MHSQGISQFYLHTPRSSANGMNHTAFAFPAEAGTHLPTPEGWKAELALVHIYVAPNQQPVIYFH